MEIVYTIINISVHERKTHFGSTKQLPTVDRHYSLDHATWVFYRIIEIKLPTFQYFTHPNTGRGNRHRESTAGNRNERKFQGNQLVRFMDFAFSLSDSQTYAIPEMSCRQILHSNPMNCWFQWTLISTWSLSYDWFREREREYLHKCCACDGRNSIQNRFFLHFTSWNAYQSAITYTNNQN